MNARLKRAATATPRHALTLFVGGWTLLLCWRAVAPDLPQVGVHTVGELRALAAVATCCAVAVLLILQLPGFARALLGGRAQPSDRESAT